MSRPASRNQHSLVDPTTADVSAPPRPYLPTSPHPPAIAHPLSLLLSPLSALLPPAQSPEALLLREETEELAELFRLVDRDGGGTISMDEFLELLHSMSVKPTPHEMTLLFNEIDGDRNGLIELSEFMAFMQDTSIKQINPQDVVAAFAMFEGFAQPSTPGRIAMADLVAAVGQYAPDAIAMQRSERHSVMERFDRQGRRRSEVVKEEVGEEQRRALLALLSAIAWDADGCVDYAEFVRRNTNYQPSSSAESAAHEQQ